MAFLLQLLGSVKQLYITKRHEEFYGSFLGQEFSEYIRKMSKDGEYGDNLTLQVLAREFYNIW